MFDCYDTLITPEEVADMLGCGMNTTYKLLKSGKIRIFAYAFFLMPWLNLFKMSLSAISIFSSSLIFDKIL